MLIQIRFNYALINNEFFYFKCGIETITKWNLIVLVFPSLVFSYKYLNEVYDMF